jgi:hypothetical protein
MTMTANDLDDRDDLRWELLRQLRLVQQVIDALDAEDPYALTLERALALRGSLRRSEMLLFVAPS